MLALISAACVFLVFLDYHKSKDIHKSIIYVVVFFTSAFLFSWAVKVLQFKLVYLVILIPLLLFGVLFLKDRNKEEVDF
jgi:multidrug transporter EmrE-like cation transporter